jgi:hypothetical protein
VQMDSKQHRILRSSVVEITELYVDALNHGYSDYAKSLIPMMSDREGRYASGEFFIKPSDSGTSEDSSGGE